MGFMDNSGSYDFFITVCLCVFVIAAVVYLGSRHLELIKSKRDHNAHTIPTLVETLSFSFIICNNWEPLASMSQVSEDVIKE